MAAAPRNFLLMIPRRSAVEQRLEGERVVISVPRFRSRLGQGFGRLLRRSPQLTLRLDERTSYCWELIDGRRNVQQLCELLQQRFGAQVEPVVQRMNELLRILERNSLISFDQE